MKTSIRKALLYKSGVEYADYCLNHVEGCSHGCKYPCYAFLMKKRCGVVKTYEEWLEPKIVSNALALLDKEIPRYKKDIKHVHLCFSTDPFMYHKDEIADLSLKIIEMLNNSDIKCTVLTKGIYPKELVQRNGKSKDNEYGITLVSLDESFRRKYEPFAAPFKERLKALKHIHDSGFKTWVSMEPYPTMNFIRQDLMEILKAVGFVDRIVFGRQNYCKDVSAQPGVREYYNGLAETVQGFCGKNEINCYIKNGTITDLAG